jgi:hypothetical protein
LALKPTSACLKEAVNAVAVQFHASRRNSAWKRN